MNPTDKQRKSTITYASHYNCPECGKSWKGMSFYPAYEKMAREMKPDITRNELRRVVRKSLKRDGLYHKKWPYLAQQENTNIYHCMYCGKALTYDEIEKLVYEKKRFRRCFPILLLIRILTSPIAFIKNITR